MKVYSDKKICEKIKKYADLTHKNILEIGCGDGRISSLLSTDSNSFIAVDPDEKRIHRAQELFSGIDFRIGSGENLNFPDNFFDIVIFTLSLHHQNGQKAIAEATRVLKNSGKILIIEPVVEGEVEQVFAFLYNEDNETREAQKFIVESELSIVNSEIFHSEWIFEDKNDVLQSLFHYYDMPFDSEIALKITDFIGNKIQSNPILLRDTMIIQSLTKILATTENTEGSQLPQSKQLRESSESRD
ncbi:class I SAM-dependent methyltransferase [Desulforhopalus vacuolatus]|uniref:class I SAM-dependent methyltransferase n=1 Tax=Desulforhopalus vacuolatus TaxID=40414 RepID=UPI00196560C6|nr:class I SAM-dependent methyltransferase [Desulforhopalus vacuolatus]MBM9519822.1 class I SAM-dependent methyltransferase [Desulforhopalus vacuolatus]